MDTYSGRLASDGQGSLIADQSEKIGEQTIIVHDANGDPVLDSNGQAIQVSVPVFKFGPDHGRPVAYDEGQYIFVAPGEPSHFERHHQKFAEMTGTVDESQTDDPDLVNADADNNPHHFEVQPDDPHYDEDAPNKTKLVQLPDAASVVASSHTETYTS